jgi:hypothetical protein
MKLLRIIVIFFLAANIPHFAWAQNGLSGAPDALRMQQSAPQYQQAPYQQTQPYAQPGYPAYNGNAAPYATGNQPTNNYSAQVAPYSAPVGYAAPQTQQFHPYASSTTTAQQIHAVRPSSIVPSSPTYRVASNSYPAYLAQQPTSPMQEPATMPNEPAIPQNVDQPRGGYVPYSGPTTTNESCQTGTESCQDASCGIDMDCGYNSCPWYASITGLAMTRNKSNQLWTTYETGNLPNQLVNTADVQSSWKIGGEIRFGRRFCVAECNPCDNSFSTSSSGYWAVEGNYWTLDPFDAFHSETNPSTVSSPLITSFSDFGGTGAIAWFDGAQEHRIWRRDEIHNAEVNIIRGQWANAYGSNWDFALSFGPRFFRFSESLRFGSLRVGGTWGGNGGVDEAYISDDITNSLWGGQVGLNMGYNCFNGALRFFMTPKVGGYNNSVTSTYQVVRGDGMIATDTERGVPVYVEASRSSFAMISQVDLGVEWFFARQWSASFGYRVVAVSGIGLADHQFPTYVNASNDVANINTNGDLILHGAFGTLTFNF